LLRGALACNGNYLNQRCHDVLRTRPFLDKCSAAAAMASESNALPHTTTWLSLNVADESGSCRQDCTEEMEGFVFTSACCARLISRATREWSLLVLPPATEQTAPANEATKIDVSQYLCRYSRPAEEACPPLALSRQVYAFNRQLEDTQACSSTSSSLSCAMQKCRLSDSLELPEECCLLDCRNGGIWPFLGSCFCDCPAPWAGVDCDLRMSQVRAAIEISSTHFVTFKADQLVAAIAENINMPKSHVEISHIRILDSGSGRRAATDQVLDVGFRVVRLQTNLQLMRMVALLLEGMRQGNFQRMMYKLGVALHSAKFREVPTAHTLDGNEACSYTPLDGQLDCNDFYVEERDTVKAALSSPPGGIPAAVVIALAVVCGLVGASAFGAAAVFYCLPLVRRIAVLYKSNTEGRAQKRFDRKVRRDEHDARFSKSAFAFAGSGSAGAKGTAGPQGAAGFKKNTVVVAGKFRSNNSRALSISDGESTFSALNYKQAQVPPEDPAHTAPKFEVSSSLIGVTTEHASGPKQSSAIFGAFASPPNTHDNEQTSLQSDASLVNNMIMRKQRLAKSLINRLAAQVQVGSKGADLPGPAHPSLWVPPSVAIMAEDETVDREEDDVFDVEIGVGIQHHQGRISSGTAFRRGLHTSRSASVSIQHAGFVDPQPGLLVPELFAASADSSAESFDGYNRERLSSHALCLGEETFRSRSVSHPHRGAGELGLLSHCYSEARSLCIHH